MKKFFLLMLTLVICIGNANATKVNLDLSAITHVADYNQYTNARWDRGTNTLYWRASNNNVVTVPGISGDLSACTDITINTSNLTEGATYRLVFKIQNGATEETYVATLDRAGEISTPLCGSTSLITKQYASQKLTPELLRHVNSFGIAGNSAATEANEHSVTFNSITFTELYSLNFDESGKAEIPLSEIEYTSEISFDEETGVLSSTGGGSFYVNLNHADFSAVQRVSMEFSGEGDNIVDRLLLVKGDGNNLMGGWYSSKFGANLTDENRASAGDIIRIKYECKSAQYAADKQMTIQKIVVTSDLISSVHGGETSLQDLQYKNFSNNSNVNATWNVGSSSDTYYGSGSSDPTNYVDLTTYESLRIYRQNKSDGFRAFFINAAGTGTNNITHTNAATRWDEAGYYEIDLSQVEKYDGKVYLNTIKSSAWGVKNVVDAIVVYRNISYVFSGSGVFNSATASALADASATSYDAAGVTGNVTLAPANPNAIIYAASTNSITATSGILVSGTTADEANFTDGNYAFKAPVAFDATSVSYDRSFTVGNPTTVCLPFALTEAEVAEAGTFYELTASTNEAVTFTTVATTEAYKPYLFKAAAVAPFANLTNKQIAVTPNACETVAGDATFHGTMVGQTAPAGCYGFSGGNFVQVTGSVNVKAFRGYITLASGSESALRVNFEQGMETSIQNIEQSDAASARFNLYGQQVGANCQGIQISNGKKFIIR